jgi:hypothetical protein
MIEVLTRLMRSAASRRAAVCATESAKLTLQRAIKGRCAPLGLPFRQVRRIKPHHQSKLNAMTARLIIPAKHAQNGAWRGLA